MDIDVVLLSRLREEAEKAKCLLSTQDEVEIQIPFVRADFNFSTKVTRSELEQLAKSVVEKTRTSCLRCLSDAKLKPADLDEVILVGGQTRMPLVRELVKEIFEKEPNTSVNPDEAVALGATIQAGILSGSIQNMVLLDITPLSLGLETFGGLMNVIIPRNTTIPTKAGEMFTNAADNQKLMRIHILQGEREMAKDNWSLGRFDLEFEPAPQGNARVGVQFEIDANGILHVLARDTKTGHQKIVEIKSAVDVSDETVEKMVAESVEHAFEDMNQRKWVEAKFKAEKLLEATESALKQIGKQISSSEIEKIQKLMDNLRSSLNSEDFGKLKDAQNGLDIGTRDIADILMNMVLESELEKKGIINS
jgi:molecular chaperone DnaK